MHLRRAGTIVLTIGGLATAGAGTGTARAADPGEQIARLQAIKRELTPPERKVDSRLAVALHNRVKAGTAEVDIDAAPGGDLVERLQALGANVRYASPRTGAIRAAVPMSELATIAGWSEVERVHEAARAMTASLRPPESKDVRAARRAARTGPAPRWSLEGDRHPRRRRRPQPQPRHRHRDEGVRASATAWTRSPTPRPRASCPPVDILPARPATATRARRCWRSSTTSRPAPSSASPRRSPASQLRRQHPRPALRRALRRDRRRRPLLQRGARSRTARSPSRSTRSPPTARCTSARPATRATRSTAPPATTRATSGLRPRRRQVRRRGARLRSRPGRAGLRPDLRARRGVPVTLFWADRSAMPPPTTTSTCSSRR